MNSIATMLSAPGRRWDGNPPATQAQILELGEVLGFDLPPHYVELLQTCNGGEGELALDPYWFVLFDTGFALEMATDTFYQSEFEGMFIFGSNGGGETIALDMRGQEPWPVVMVDCIAGMESARIVAPSIDDFIKAIGLPAQDPTA
jgi:SMI1/KNR4 family protein SUKH-1